MQALEVPSALQLWAAEQGATASIDWVIRQDLTEIAALQPAIHHLWAVPRRGLGALLTLGWKLRREGYTHIYDAHDSLRSRMLRAWIRWLRPLPPRLLVRGKGRFRRWLFFKAGIREWQGRPLIPQPYSARASYLLPLRAWGVSENLLRPSLQGGLSLLATGLREQPLEGGIPLAGSGAPPVCVPGSAWSKKNWPAAHWVSFLGLLHTRGELPAVALLGGESDAICDAVASGLTAAHPGLQVINLRGRTSLRGSSAWLARAPWIAAVDTGWLHLADQLGVPALALLGPTAFGFPSSISARVARLSPALSCQPCTKDGSGGCSQDVYQRCLVELTPAHVVTAHHALREATSSV